MNLIIFNYESNMDSRFSFALDWINEISKNVSKVYVVSLRCGKYKVNDNVEIYCVGQDKKSRLQTILSIWKILDKIHKQDKNINGYFVHMAHYFVPLIYPFSVYFSQKIVLWYAHKSVPLSLQIANFFTDVAVASTSIGYQIKTDKLKIIGQGIDTTKRFLLKSLLMKKLKILYLLGE